MYEISTLKEKKLPELQSIAKSIGLKRTSGLKKQDLIYQIIDHIAANPPAEKKPQKEATKKDQHQPREEKVAGDKKEKKPEQKTAPENKKRRQSTAKQRAPSAKKAV